MSVNTWNRTENRKLEALVKAIELASHSIICCDNDNIFPKRHRHSINADIIKEAKLVVKVINRANTRDLYTEFEDRLALQNQALDTLADLEMDLQIAFLALKPNITERKLDNWLRLIDETRTLLKRLMKANKEDYEKYCSQTTIADTTEGE